MRQRFDPLVPILGSAVALVVIGAAAFIFYPALSRFFGPGQPAVAREQASPSAIVPVWVCRAESGVALMLESGCDQGSARALDRGLVGGPHRYLRLSVYNFARKEPFLLELPREGFDTPEGGPRARPAAHLLRPDAPAHLLAVLRGLGAVTDLRVGLGRNGHALLVVSGDPSSRTAFVSGRLRFERRELERLALASWRAQPALETFLEW